MATELCPAEINISRISFSHDFCSSSSTTFPMQQYLCPLPSTSSFLPLNSFNVDFEFDVGIDNIDQGCYSSADELFCNGKILPLQIKKKGNNSPPKQDQERQQPPPRKPQSQAKTSSSKDIKVLNVDEEEETSNQKDQSDSKSSSFWQFKRSRSLNFLTGTKRIFYSSLRRSSSASAGPAPKAKPGPLLKDCEKENYSFPFLQSSSTRNPKSNWKKSSTSTSTSTYKSHWTINPTLNVPLADIFCLNAVFLTGKGKKKCQSQL